MDDHEVKVTFTFHAMADTEAEAIGRVMKYFYGAGNSNKTDIYPILVEVTCEDK